MRRGETEGFLYTRLTPPETEALGTLDGLFVRGTSPAAEQVRLACDDCLKRLLGFSMEVEARHLLQEEGRRGSDPRLRPQSPRASACLALGQKVTSASTRVPHRMQESCCSTARASSSPTTCIYPGRSRGEEMEAAGILNMVRIHKVEAIAIGNGTASRETEAFVKKLKLPPPSRS